MTRREKEDLVNLFAEMNTDTGIKVEVCKRKPFELPEIVCSLNQQDIVTLCIEHTEKASRPDCTFTAFCRECREPLTFGLEECPECGVELDWEDTL